MVYNGIATVGCSVACTAGEGVVCDLEEAMTFLMTSLGRRCVSQFLLAMGARVGGVAF